MTQSLADLSLTEQDFAEPTHAPEERERRGPGRPRKNPLGRSFSARPLPPMLSASPAATPTLDIQSPHDRFPCRPYGIELTARGCVSRQEARRGLSGGHVPTHLRFCSGCKLGEAVAAGIRGEAAPSAPSQPVEKAPPPADVGAGGPGAVPDDARDVRNEPTRPEASDESRPGRLLLREPPTFDPPPLPEPPRATIPPLPSLESQPGDLAAIEERLTRRHVQSTMAILDSLDELRRIVSDLVTASQEANERIVRQVGAHVAVGRPSVVAEQVLALLSDVPTMFADLTERTEMRRDVLKAALGRLARQERAMWTTLGWVRVDGAEREAAPSADAGPIPGRSETRRERDARARAQRAEGLGGAER